MKSGYDQYFQQARKTANQRQEPVMEKPKFKVSPPPFSTKRKRRKHQFPVKTIILILMGVSVVGYSFLHIDELEKFATRLEFGLLESSFAQESPAAAKAVSANSAEAPNKAPASVEKSESPQASESFQSEEHFKVLAQRKKQLDEREAQLARSEAELEVQKKAIEAKLQELEETRRKISSVLEDKVKVDEQKVETLVQMYTNMKAPQAAKIFETLDEDLAIEILSRMKKKNAADIMNLIKPEKAQIFSEKYAGFKTK